MFSDRTLRLPEASLADLARVRAFVSEAARDAGMAPVAVADLVLAVDEAAANVLRHGYAGGSGPLEVEVEVEVQVDGSELVVLIRDEAPTFDPTGWPAPALDTPLQKRQPGGMGIHLTRECVDRVVHVSRDGAGNELALSVRLTGRGGDHDADHR